ncbi:MAG: aromatic ring-hydroxylating dioxygenase subunit alpha [Actinomycetota bacterium]|nr:aromatic ring-hydroxylating dioxygenase subunit alpha [Actinomycetota bacterium]
MSGIAADGRRPGDPLDDELAALVEPDRVHRRVYTDPAIFDGEMRSVFGRTWTYLVHESELPAAGDFRQVRVGRRPVLVTRGDDGAVRAVLNRCTHRGTTVESAERGCAKRFTCPYHGWTFANDGRLVGVPYPGNYVEMDRDRLALTGLTVASHRGFVFGTLAPEPEPLLDWLGPAAALIDDQVDRCPGGRVRVLPTALTLEYQGNWKLAWDNAADGLHATYAHRSYNELGLSADTTTVLERDPGATPMVAKVLGRGHMVVDQRPGIPDGPWATMRPLPFIEAPAAELRDRLGAEAERSFDLATGSMVNLSLFPNLIFVGNQLMVVEPVEVDRTRLHLFLLLADDAPEEINLMRLRVDEDFVSFGTPDDLAMFERVQAGLSIPEVPWIDTSRGLGAPSDTVGDDGLLTGPITSEAPQRAYLAEWLTLMTGRR